MKPILRSVMGATLIPVMALTWSAFSACTPLPEGIVGWWRAENNTFDSIGLTDALLKNGAGFAEGKVGSAFVFDGVDDEVTIPASSNLNVKSITIEGWIFPYTVSRAQPLVDYLKLGIANGVSMWLSMGSSGYAHLPVPGALYVNLMAVSGGNNVVYAQANIPSNQWTHVAVTYDYASGMAALYANGACLTTQNVGQITLQTGLPVSLGRRETVASYAGKLDELSIYNRALTSQEILAIAQAGVVGKCPPDTPPLLITEGQNLLAALYSQVQLRAEAVGAWPLYFQWYFNGTNVLEGATNSTYEIASAQLQDSGEYSVVVSNAFGVVTGVVAQLSVQMLPPVIVQQPASQTVLLGQEANFSVEVTGTPPLAYQWYFNGEILEGATNAALTVPSVTLSNAGNYQVIISNDLGMVTSAMATLTVTLPPSRLSILSTQAVSGTRVFVPVVLQANGRENALQFSAQYSATSRLSFVSVQAGEGLSEAVMLVNTNQAAVGRVGVALSLPAQQTLSPGEKVLVVLVFDTAPLASNTTVTLSFGDSPVIRQVSDAQAQNLAASYNNGVVTLWAAEYEGDVAPRGASDRRVTVTDWVQVGRFVAMLDEAAPGLEFQKADCAPRSEGGNGILAATDWVQAGRYAAGLDPLIVASGPTQPVEGQGLVRTAQAGTGAQGAAATVKVGGNTLIAGEVNTVPVILVAHGEENALTFTLRFDPAQVTFVEARAANGQNVTLHVNAARAAQGSVGVALALPTGQKFAAGEQALLQVALRAAPDARGTVNLALDSSLLPREVSDAQANALAAAWDGAALAVALPAPQVELRPETGTLSIAWPVNMGQVVLEATDSLSTPQWRPVEATPVEREGSLRVEIPAQNTTRFFRLRGE